MSRVYSHERIQAYGTLLSTEYQPRAVSSLCSEPTLGLAMPSGCIVTYGDVFVDDPKRNKRMKGHLMISEMF